MLPDEVREAMERMDAAFTMTGTVAHGDDWMAIRAHLLAREAEVADAWHDAMAAHALLQAINEMPAQSRGWLNDRAAEILAGWLGGNDYA